MYSYLKLFKNENKNRIQSTLNKWINDTYINALKYPKWKTETFKNQNKPKCIPKINERKRNISVTDSS